MAAISNGIKLKQRFYYKTAIYCYNRAKYRKYIKNNHIIMILDNIQKRK